MRIHYVPGEKFILFAQFFDGSERPLVQQSERRDNAAGTVTQVVISYDYRPDGSAIERERAEVYDQGQAHPWHVKQVIREMANTPVRLPLRLMEIGLEDKIVDAKVMVLGYTTEGADKPEENPHERWTRFLIDQNIDLALFNGVDTSQRQPAAHEPAGYTHIVLKSRVDGTYLTDAIQALVNGRRTVMFGSTEITLVYAPDVDGHTGPLVKALVRCGTWEPVD